MKERLIKLTSSGMNKVPFQQLACLLLLTGIIGMLSCKKKSGDIPDPDDVLVPVVVHEEPAQKITISEALPASERPLVAQDVVRSPGVVVETDPRSIRVSALLELPGGEKRAGLVHAESGASDLVKEQDSFAGYIVEQIDIENDRVLLSMGGSTISVAMRGISYVEATRFKIEHENIERRNWLDSLGGDHASPVEGEVIASRAEFELMLQGEDDGMNSAPIDINSILKDLERYEPIRTELLAEIDPNDPATWPVDYKGPGIERVLAAPSRDHPQDTEHENDFPVLDKETPGETYSATPDEIARGIDPNNPDTWPDGYRGPAIERSLMEYGETTLTNEMDSP